MEVSVTPKHPVMMHLILIFALTLTSTSLATPLFSNPNLEQLLENPGTHLERFKPEVDRLFGSINRFAYQLNEEEFQPLKDYKDWIQEPMDSLVNEITGLTGTGEENQAKYSLMKFKGLIPIEQVKN